MYLCMNVLYEGVGVRDGAKVAPLLYVQHTALAGPRPQLKAGALISVYNTTPSAVWTLGGST